MTIGKKGITVRFDEGEVQQLGSLAERHRVSSATILRWALRALADHVERNDGRLVLPLELGREGPAGESPPPPEPAAATRSGSSKAARQPKA